MHEACAPARVGLSGLLLNRQCIHVGPKPESSQGDEEQGRHRETLVTQ